MTELEEVLNGDDAMITLAAPCIRHYHLLGKLFASAERGSMKPNSYVVIDNGTKCKESGVALPPNTDIHNFGRNIGVAAAWNAVFRMYPDHIIISNDDVEVHVDTIEKLITAAEQSDAEFLYPDHAGAMFCVFLMKRSLIERIGPFDEKFHPAYFEDNDFHRRMKLAGVKELQVRGVSYSHVGSASLKDLSPKQLEEHHQRFRMNRAYYEFKWGGIPGQETLTVPRKSP